MNMINSSAAEKYIRQVEEIAVKIEELEAISPYIKGSGTPKRLKALAQRMKALPENDWQAAEEALQDIPDWHHLSDYFDETIAAVMIAFKENTVEPKYKGNAQMRAVCTLDPCPDKPTQEQVDNLLIGVAATELVVAGLQLTADAIKIFSEKLGNIAQTVADAVAIVAKTLAVAAVSLQRQVNLNNLCEDNAVKKLLISMCETINAISSKLDSAIGALEEIKLKLDRLIELVNEVKEVVDEILLHQIEEALADCKKLIGMYLPESANGSLNEVQSIVEELIYNSKIAGLTTANAQAYYRQGLAAISNGQYENALQWFMLSYKQLQDKDMCKVPCPCDPCEINRKC